MKQLAAHWPAEQSCAAPHATPSASGEYALVDTAGWHDAQVLVGLNASAVTTASPTTQADTQLAARQNFAVPHDAASASAVHSVRETSGLHTWQAFVGSSASAATLTPAMEQVAGSSSRQLESTDNATINVTPIRMRFPVTNCA